MHPQRGDRGPVVPLVKLLPPLFLYFVVWSSLTLKPVLEICARPFFIFQSDLSPWNRTQRTLHPCLVCTCRSDYTGFGHIRQQWSRIAVLWQQLGSELLRGWLNGLPLWNVLSLCPLSIVTQEGLALGSWRVFMDTHCLQVVRLELNAFSLSEFPLVWLFPFFCVWEVVGWWNVVFVKGGWNFVLIPTGSGRGSRDG